MDRKKLEDAWEEAAGRFAGESRAVDLRKGLLTVLVSHSIIAVELSFESKPMLRRLRNTLPELSITKLRFRVGVVR